MNKLPLAKRVAILNGLCEGLSMRAVARLQEVSFNTVAKALVDAGPICAQMHDELVRDVKAKRAQCDEIWAFNYCKERNRASAKAAPADAAAESAEATQSSQRRSACSAKPQRPPRSPLPAPAAPRGAPGAP